MTTSTHTDVEGPATTLDSTAASGVTGPRSRTAAGGLLLLLVIAAAVVAAARRRSR